MQSDDDGMRGCSIGVLLGIKKETMGLFKNAQFSVHNDNDVYFVDDHYKESLE